MPPLALEMLADFFPGVADLSGQLMPRSLDEYCRDAEYYIVWCGYERDRALDPQQLRAWRQYQVDHTTLSPNTITRRLHAVKSLVWASARREAIDQAVAFRFSLVESVPLSSLRQRLKTF